MDNKNVLIIGLILMFGFLAIQSFDSDTPANTVVRAADEDNNRRGVSAPPATDPAPGIRGSTTNPANSVSAPPEGTVKGLTGLNVRRPVQEAKE